LPKLVWHEDEPLAHPSSVPLYFVSHLAQQHVKVVLTGEGSDELFAGYGRYRLYLLNWRLGRYYHLLPRAGRESVRSGIAATSLLSGAQRRKLQHSFLGRGEEFESLYIDNSFSAFSRAEQRGLLRSAAVPPTYDSFMRHWNAFGDGPVLPRMLYTDQKTYLVELLMKQDQMSMASSIESRVPFLDHPFVEFSTRVPDRLKTGGSGKYILKKAVEDLLPHDIIYRTKMGFPTPLRQWLWEADAVAQFDKLREPGGMLADYLNLSAVTSLIEQHQARRIDATDRIWRLLNLQLWGERFLR